MTTAPHHDLNDPCRRCRGTWVEEGPVTYPRSSAKEGEALASDWGASRPHACAPDVLPCPWALLERPQDPGRGRLSSPCLLAPHLGTPRAQPFDPSFLPRQVLLSLKRGWLFSCIALGQSSGWPWLIPALFLLSDLLWLMWRLLFCLFSPAHPSPLPWHTWPQWAHTFSPSSLYAFFMVPRTPGASHKEGGKHSRALSPLQQFSSLKSENNGPAFSLLIITWSKINEAVSGNAWYAGVLSLCLPFPKDWSFSQDSVLRTSFGSCSSPGS